MFRCRLLKVATPPLGLTLMVLPPLKVPGPVALTVTAVALVARLPNWSRTCTVTAGLMAKPAVVLVGCWRTAGWPAAAARMVKLFDEGPVRPVEAVAIE